MRLTLDTMRLVGSRRSIEHGDATRLTGDQNMTRLTGDQNMTRLTGGQTMTRLTSDQNMTRLIPATKT